MYTSYGLPYIPNRLWASQSVPDVYPMLQVESDPDAYPMMQVESCPDVYSMMQ
jgi:hypothetical protein